MGESKLLYRSSCSFSAGCVVAASVSKFPLSFCLIRNLTMFSLVQKKKRYNKQPSLFSCDVFLPHSVWSSTNWRILVLFFHVALAFMLLRKHSLKSVAQKKKKKVISIPWSPVMCGGHRTHHYVLNLCNLLINVDPVCLILYLSAVLLNHRELQRLQKLRRRMAARAQCDAKRVPHHFPGRCTMPFSSLMIHLPIIKRASLPCLIQSNKA